MGWRRLAHRLPLTGVAVAGAVVGHMVAYVLAVPEPTARVALLGATGHAYWTAAIAAAVVLGLASVSTTLLGRFRAGLVASRSQPGESVARLARHLAAATDRSFVVGFGDEPAYAGEKNSVQLILPSSSPPPRAATASTSPGPSRARRSTRPSSPGPSRSPPSTTRRRSGTRP
jgi:hypothetical protein